MSSLARFVNDPSSRSCIIGKGKVAVRLTVRQIPISGSSVTAIRSVVSGEEVPKYWYPFLSGRGATRARTRVQVQLMKETRLSSTFPYNQPCLLASRLHENNLGIYFKVKKTPTYCSSSSKTIKQ